MAAHALERHRSRHLAWPCLLALVFVGYALGALLSLRLLHRSDLGAALFPPAGLMVGVLVLSARRRWPLLVAVGLAAEILVDRWQAPDRVGITLAAMVVANTAGPVAVALILAALGRGRPPDLARRPGLLRFVAATAAGTLLSALVGAGGMWWDGGPFRAALLQWWLGSSLGVVLIGGAILARVAGPDRRTLWSAEGVAMVVLIPSVIGWLYHVTNLPIGFTILLGLLPAAVRFGARAVTLLVVLMVSAVMLNLNLTDVTASGLSRDTALLLFKVQVEVHVLAALFLSAEVVEREQAVAEVALEHQWVLQLQRALLPAERLAGNAFRAEGVYLAASDRGGVGGDWYDVVALADGRVFACVGDVVGHGVGAVVAMGRLRFALGAIAGLGGTPGGILARLDEEADRIEGARFATVWVAVYDPRQGELAYSSAGHPPALLRQGGGARWLDQARSVPIGSHLPVERPTATVPVSGPASVLLFTDGAVERRGESLDVGLERLARAERVGGDGPVGQLLDQVRDPAGRDDAVVLRVNLEPQGLGQAEVGKQDRGARSRARP